VITPLERQDADCRERPDPRKLDAAATVIAALHHDNHALREHIASREQNVTNIDKHRASRSRTDTVIGPC
jgi:hypothetical protein